LYEVAGEDGIRIELEDTETETFDRRDILDDGCGILNGEVVKLETVNSKLYAMTKLTAKQNVGLEQKTRSAR